MGRVGVGRAEHTFIIAWDKYQQCFGYGKLKEANCIRLPLGLFGGKRIIGEKRREVKMHLKDGPGKEVGFDICCSQNPKNST